MRTGKLRGRVLVVQLIMVSGLQHRIEHYASEKESRFS